MLAGFERSLRSDRCCHTEGRAGAGRVSKAQQTYCHLHRVQDQFGERGFGLNNDHVCCIEPYMWRYFVPNQVSVCFVISFLKDCLYDSVEIGIQTITRMRPWRVRNGHMFKNMQLIKPMAMM